MPTNAEVKIKALAKKKPNTICPNCGLQKKFGFNSVCIKFLTFVCNECKTSHQAISHRIKSITMSHWTEEEVKELANGGNELARQTWLKHAPPVGTGGRPGQGSDINVYKQFIVEVYERKRYYGEAEQQQQQQQQQYAQANDAVVPPAQQLQSGSSVAAQRRLQKKKQQQQRGAQSFVSPPAPVAAPAPPPAAPVADLLDFSSPATTIPSQTPAPAPVSSNVSTDMFQANFDVFQSAPSEPTKNKGAAPKTDLFGDFTTNQPQTATVSTTTTTTDMFGTTTATFASAPGPMSGGNSSAFSMQPSQPTPQSTAQQPDLFNTSNAASGFSFMNGNGSASSSNDASGLLSMNQMPADQKTKKPIMGNNAMADSKSTASAISMMGGQQQPSMMMPQQRQQGMAMNNMNTMQMNSMVLQNQGMNMGMMNTMNPQAMMMMQQQQQQMMNNMRAMNNNNNGFTGMAGVGMMNPQASMQMMNMSGTGQSNMMMMNNGGQQQMMMNNNMMNAMNPNMMNYGQQQKRK